MADVEAGEDEPALINRLTQEVAAIFPGFPLETLLGLIDQSLANLQDLGHDRFGLALDVLVDTIMDHPQYNFGGLYQNPGPAAGVQQPQPGIFRPPQIPAMPAMPQHFGAPNGIFAARMMGGGNVQGQYPAQQQPVANPPRDAADLRPVAERLTELTDMFSNVSPQFFEAQLALNRPMAAIVDMVLTRNPAVVFKANDGSESEDGEEVIGYVRQAFNFPPNMQHLRSWTEVDLVTNTYTNRNDMRLYVYNAQHAHGFGLIFERDFSEFLNNEYNQVAVRTLVTLSRYFYWSYPMVKTFLDGALPQLPANRYVNARPACTVDVFGKEETHAVHRIQQSRRKRQNLWGNHQELVKQFEFLRLHQIRQAMSSSEVRQLDKDVKDVAEREQRLERARADGTLLDCPICYEECVPEDMLSCEVGHQVCGRCLYEDTNQGMKSDFKCIGDTDCDMEYDPVHLPLFLPRRMIREVEQRSYKHNVAIPDLTLETCIRCGIPFEVDIDVNVNKVLTCPRCKKETCRICKNDWSEHFGIPCKEMEGDEDTQRRKRFEEEMTRASIRHCHRCDTALMKIEGCNKLTCRCGATLCYLCRAGGIQYDHFCNHFIQTPGSDCDQCKRCRLYQSAQPGDEARIRQLQEEAARAEEEVRGKKRVIGVDEDRLNNVKRICL